MLAHPAAAHMRGYWKNQRSRTTKQADCSSTDHGGAVPSGRRLVGQPAQRHTHGIVEIAIVEVRSAQPQPGGDAFQEYAALFCWQAAGSGHDQGKLIV